MIPLNADQQLLLEILKNENKPMFVSEIMKEIPRGKNWIYTNLGILKRYGMIKVDEALKKDANKKVTTFEYDTKLSDIDIPNWMFLVDLDEQTTTHKEKNDEKEQLFGCLQILKEIDEKRLEQGLKQKYEQYYVNLFYFLNDQENQTTNHIATTNDQQTTTNNQSVTISHQLNDLKDFIKINKDAGYTISYDILTHKFDCSFIDKCIDQHLLNKNCKNEYEFRR